MRYRLLAYIGVLIIGGLPPLQVHGQTQPSAAQTIEHLSIGLTRYGDRRTYYVGEPVLIRVNCDPTETMPPAVRDGQMLWHDMVRVRLWKVVSQATSEPASSQPSNDANRTTVAGGSTERQDRPYLRAQPYNNVMIVKHGTQPGKQPLKTGQRSVSYWAIDPNQSDKLDIGQYIVEVTWKEQQGGSQGPRTITDLTSNMVECEVIAPVGKQAQSDVLSSRAAYLLKIQQLDAAETLYKKALALTPDTMSLHVDMGTICERKGDVDGAIREYNMYVEWVKTLPQMDKDGIKQHAETIESRIRMLTAKKGK